MEYTGDDMLDDLLPDEIPEFWEGDQIPNHLIEVIGDSEEELKQHSSWIDCYLIKGPIFQRNGKWVFRVEKVRSDTYEPC